MVEIKPYEVYRGLLTSLKMWKNSEMLHLYRIYRAPAIFFFFTNIHNLRDGLWDRKNENNTSKHSGNTKAIISLDKVELRNAIMQGLLLTTDNSQ
jgi:hypothetical protein